MHWDINLDKSSDIPLYRQLSHALTKLIATKELAPNTKLPPIRQMARALDVNNTTVVSAYKDLERKTAVYSVVGSGTYVASGAASLPAYNQPVITDDYINFAHMATEAALFPVAAFKRAFNAVIDRDGAMAFSANHSGGYGPLRESICQMLDGIRVSPGHIHLVSGAEQGMDILAGNLLAPGETVFVEPPAPYGAVAAFQHGRVNIVEMPMAKYGPDFDCLEALLKRHRPKIIYVTPNFRQPVGTCYSAESKRRLLEFASTYDLHIIEEDQLSDFYYDGNKRTPLKALDNEGRVIYIKKFPKILTQDIGIEFMVWPDNLPDIKPGNNISPPGYALRAFDYFLRNGDYEAHAANMRSIYGRRYQKITAAARTYLAPLADYELPGGGLSLWVTPRVGNGEDYAEKFLQRKVVVSPGRLFGMGEWFRVSFAAVPEERIAEGIGVIAAVLSQFHKG
ncbi:MAG: PLP-dependent aminotransferase family protein [Defluviitaleaceae bacterium]|nr:PLP-dependent aminotransferase family protein [Defluviitaleaceae bacterium]